MDDEDVGEGVEVHLLGGTTEFFAGGAVPGIVLGQNLARKEGKI